MKARGTSFHEDSLECCQEADPAHSPDGIRIKEEAALRI